MTPEEIGRIEAFAGELSGEITLTLRCTADRRSDALRQFAIDFNALAPAVRIKATEGDAESLPAFQITPNLTFAGIPLGRELAPFLQMLLAANESATHTPGRHVPRLEAVTLPADLDLYVAPHCAHCPESVQRIYPLAMASTAIRVAIIDGTFFTERAGRIQLKAVPTLIADGQVRWSGSIALDEIVSFLETRDPASLGAASLVTLLKEGKAARLAEMMSASGKLFPAFFELATHAQWPVRLGAMVALEHLQALNPDLAAEAGEPIWRRFERAPDAVKGDILYLLGELGGRQARRRLEAVSTGPYSRAVREAASDALRNLCG